MEAIENILIQMMIMRMNKMATRRCAYCGNTFEVERTKCPSCGGRVKEVEDEFQIFEYDMI